jgi:hypothetical protein
MHERGERTGVTNRLFVLRSKLGVLFFSFGKGFDLNTQEGEEKLKHEFASQASFTLNCDV